MSAKERSPVTGAILVANGEDVPRLSAVVERQRRELARARADGAAAVVVATARGVLMERHGLSPRDAYDQLRSRARSQRRKLGVLSAEVVASAERRS